MITLKVVIKRPLEIEVSSEELAQTFCEMNDFQQAEFFIAMSKYVKENWCNNGQKFPTNFKTQMQFVVFKTQMQFVVKVLEESKINIIESKDALTLMKLIGNATTK